MAAHKLSSFPPALGLSVAVLLGACGAPTPPPRPSADGGQQLQGPARVKSITVGVTSGAQVIGIVGSTTSAGGWTRTTEIHSNGLITSDFSTRKPIGRLAERVPSVEDGTLSVLPDGRMRVVFHLRRGVTWQDGAPFTAHDLVFSYQLLSDPGIPNNFPEGVSRMQSVEAPDDHTAIFYFKTVYYLGGILGLHRFWPQPRHLLADPYERYLATKNPDEVANLPYWTSGYIHLGPFRLTEFDPGEGAVFEAYDRYFLGRPKVDIVRVRTFGDPNTLLANLLAGTVDLFADNALPTDLGFQLKDRWEASGEGVVHVSSGSARFLVPQWRPGVQAEPANLDPRVRAALYQAIDREAVTERELPAWSLLPPGDRLYEATRDGFRRYPYDPERSKAILRELGWTQGPDGVLRHSSDGRRFRNTISVTVGARTWEVSVYGDYWRRIGIEVEEHIIPSAQVRDREVRALYPSWEASAAGEGDGIFSRLMGPAASAANRWVGERGGYEDPRAQELIDRYYSSLSERDQFQAMKAISDFVVAELPLLLFYYNVYHIGVRRGVRAQEDVGGAANFSSPPFGTFTRNSHLWDVR